jgi:hypothetical protein
MFRKIAILLAATPLAACQSFSFGSPAVTTHVKVERYDEFDCTAIPKKTNDVEVEIRPTMIGATTLVDNFVLAYRCAEQDLANGRQIFEVPAFLSAAAGLVGPAAFGFTTKDVLKLGAAGAVLNAGNSYYAPKTKAGMLSSALRAVLCVKTEAVGIDYFRHKDDEKPADGGEQDREADLRKAMDFLAAENRRLDDLMRAEATRMTAIGLIEENAIQMRQVTSALVREAVQRSSRASDDKILIDAERQYFEMVAASLFSIESVLAERLRDAGSTDDRNVQPVEGTRQAIRRSGRRRREQGAFRDHVRRRRP